MQAIEQITADTRLHTGDLGGRATTAQVLEALCAKLSVATATARAA
jgi:tartrate dehydrogenase/decarboxylase/D-malate dehydrogenase